MGRRTGFEGFLRATVRAAAASERERQRGMRAQLVNARHRERQQRMALAQQSRDTREAEKQAKAQYLSDRHAEVEDLNAELQYQLKALEDLLSHTLAHDDRISFNSLRKATPFKPFHQPAELAQAQPPSPLQIPPPSGLRKFFPGANSKHAEKVARAREQHVDAMAIFDQLEAGKRSRLHELLRKYEEEKARYEADAQRHNAEITDFETRYLARESEAVLTYNEMVLTRSEYPAEGFPQRFRIAFNEASSELVVEYDLPEVSVIPSEFEYRYVKTKDAIESKARKPSEIKQRYQDVVAAIALRTLHEVFEADQAQALVVVTINGVIDTHDPASGKEVRIPVVSVRVTKEEFLALRLEKVDKVACLRSLGAQVSNRPDELQAIRPIVEFDMVDKRFIEQGDALSGLETRPNLLDLTPGDFEVLVSNLFSAMGLETKLTRSSRDGGVDAIAFDTRPVLGGKVVIQAKRYRDTVGVSAVRDLYGTMLNEGQTRGYWFAPAVMGLMPIVFQRTNQSN